MVDPDEAAKNKDWWMDERYAIYDLSPNSATAVPAHDETLDLATAPEYYTVQGYAYSGGGRRITRVQISLDQGKSWRFGNVEYPEDRYRAFEDKQLFGGRLDMDWRETSFCWCFWKLNFLVEELKEAKDIVVRAMDESMNIQPRDMYWSVLGMMNNPWFRVVVHNEGGVLRFEHPTQPALMPGGWMERVKKSGGNLANGYWGERIEGEEAHAAQLEAPKEIKMTKDGLKKEISLEEFREHNSAESPWFVVNGEVYDGTSFLEGHPGGAQSIISAAGLDSTDEFMAIRKLVPSVEISASLTASRQRNGESNDARVSRWYPKRSSPSPPRRGRTESRIHRTASRLPRLPLLDESPTAFQKDSILGHPHLHLQTRTRRPSTRPPHRPTPHDPPQRPRNPRIHHSFLHAHLRDLQTRLHRCPHQSLLRDIGSPRWQNDQSPRRHTHRPLRRDEGPNREVRI